jgi:hypothetical protein
MDGPTQTIHSRKVLQMRTMIPTKKHGVMMQHAHQKTGVPFVLDVLLERRERDAEWLGSCQMGATDRRKAIGVLAPVLPSPVPKR